MYFTYTVRSQECLPDEGDEGSDAQDHRDVEEHGSRQHEVSY